ncbi:hypothetical protein T06_3436 [Trichinella sp. T6]|nr:hypothetical protein T06_3436 [Trichinella sp. T6]
MAVKQPTDLVLKTDYEDRKARLPRLNLPKFDGDVTRFREFLDQFEVSVHQQVDLSNARKLAYFCGCLITIEYGVALDALRGLSAANQGYELAVQRLKERFDRPLVTQPEYRALSSGGATVLSLCHRIPVLKILTGEWKHLQFLDPIFDDSSDVVHVMIGIDYYYRFGVDYLRSSESTPNAQDSCYVQRCSGAESRELAPSLLGDRKDRSLFQKRVRCTRSGEDEELLYDGNRYSVRLLWRKNEWNLPDNFAVAKAVSRHLKDGWPESHHDGATQGTHVVLSSSRGQLRGTRAKDFVRRSSELLGSGGFHLAKWASNAPEALVDRLTEEILWNRHSRLGKTIGWAVPSSHAAILQIAIMLCKPSCLDESYWERLVQSVKTALKATLGQWASPDELRTVLCVVEARVNDHPLTFVGSDVHVDSGPLLHWPKSNLESVTWYWSLTTTLHDAIGPLARWWSCLLAVMGCHSLQRSRPRQASCADRSAP